MCSSTVTCKKVIKLIRIFCTWKLKYTKGSILRLLVVLFWNRDNFVTLCEIWGDFVSLTVDKIAGEEWLGKNLFIYFFLEEIFSHRPNCQISYTLVTMKSATKLRTANLYLKDIIERKYKGCYCLWFIWFTLWAIMQIVKQQSLYR